MGIIGLITPILALSFSLCCAGIQTAVSKYVAAENAIKHQTSTYYILFGSILLTVSLSTVLSILIYINSDWIAKTILFEERTAVLLRILSFTFPLSAIHSCINGYYYGKKNARIPALLQLCEQLVRVGSVFLLSNWMLQQGHNPPLGIIIVSMGIAELSTLMISLFIVTPMISKVCFTRHRIKKTSIWMKKIFVLSLPLSLSRVIVNLLQSVEAISIPQKLQAYGFTQTTALSMYGVLSGMALSFILFPTALTNSVSVMLLPVISEAEEINNRHMIAKAITKSITYGALLGSLCTFFFLFFGNFAGEYLFHSQLCGIYIKNLSLMCPFLYITTTLNSILHGLGKTVYSSLINISSLLIRILCVFFLIPQIGINGYFVGLIISQLFSCLFCILYLNRYRMY